VRLTPKYNVTKIDRKWFVIRDGEKASPALTTKQAANEHSILRIAADLRYLETCDRLEAINDGLCCNERDQKPGIRSTETKTAEVL